MSTDLESLRDRALADITAAQNLRALDEQRVGLLGKKGEITSRLKSLGKLPADQRKVAGGAINNHATAAATPAAPATSATTGSPPEPEPLGGGLPPLGPDPRFLPPFLPMEPPPP